MSRYVKTDPVTSTESIEQLPLLMTIRQAASVGGWSEKHVRDLLAKGEIKGCKLGHSWRVHRDAFLATCGFEV